MSKLAPASSASKELLLRILQDRVKQIEAKNRELKKQIEILYSQLVERESNAKTQEFV